MWCTCVTQHSYSETEVETGGSPRGLPTEQLAQSTQQAEQEEILPRQGLTPQRGPLTSTCAQRSLVFAHTHSKD